MVTYLLLNKGENEVGLREVTLQPQSIWKNNLDCINTFQGVFVSLVLEAKPLISDESVCLQSDKEKIFYLFALGRTIF